MLTADLRPLVPLGVVNVVHVVLDLCALSIVAAVHEPLGLGVLDVDELLGFGVLSVVDELLGFGVLSVVDELLGFGVLDLVVELLGFGVLSVVDELLGFGVLSVVDELLGFGVLSVVDEPVVFAVLSDEGVGSGVPVQTTPAFFVFCLSC